MRTRPQRCKRRWVAAPGIALLASSAFRLWWAEPITGGNSGFIGFPSPPGILGIGPGFRQGEQLTLIVRGGEIVKDAPR